MFITPGEWARVFVPTPYEHSSNSRERTGGGGVTLRWSRQGKPKFDVTFSRKQITLFLYA